ncbi:hypothetical protein KG112_10580 [Nocardioides sp. zg-ZUI104]|uniref:hypothetical protein n=1 Tax=Nocardioides faecalis TaxID=2803858 RepID=UPI001BCEB560|nr:hypothetical protein [Nocardioides faecalis]MBS4753246.1 hypothetical protein [Nocardioides faecalis]
MFTGDALWEQFCKEHGTAPEKRKQWFVEEPIHQDGQTWLLQANVWGPSTQVLADGLDEFGGGLVSMAPL